jgi:staphylococcal nuclease domain-containing protein 1
MVEVFFAKVKSVLSADTLILTSSSGTQERTLTLAYLQSPRLQSNEKYAFEARELLRTLLVGKKVKFWVLYKNSTNREFGDISSPIFQSLVEYVLSKGAAKLRDNINSFDDDEDIEKLRKIQKDAELAKLGLWDPNYKKIELVTRPDVIDSTPIDSIVEKVLSGDRLLVRLLLTPKRHCIIPVLIAGIKTPRSSSNDEPAEEFGDEAKAYVEARLLMGSIKVELIGESLSGVLVGKIIHSNGNIAEKLLQDGLAEVSDWQSSLLGSKAMATLRKDEKEARTSAKKIWKKYASLSSQSSNDSGFSTGKTISAVVAKIISSDTLVIRSKDGLEKTVQLISLRAPRSSDPSTSSFVSDAKEYARHKLIGKHVDVTIESIREANENFEERPLVTLRTSDGKNINEDIVANGYASVIRHRKGEHRPDYWDGLVETESMAIKAKKGIHGKAPIPENLVDASESAMRAKPYLFSFQNRNKISGIVDYVVSGNRFRINLPNEGIKLTLVLGGLTNFSSREDNFAKKALELANKKFYQRDVNIEIYNVDKIGSFIGNIFLPGSNIPFQVNLLKDGLSQIHERSVTETKYASQLTAAQNEAREKRFGIWENYDPAEEEDSAESLSKQIENLKIEKKYLDVEICEVLNNGLIAFHILDAEKTKLKAFMAKFHAVSSTFKHAPSLKRNDIIAAKLIDNGKFYRAKVLEINKLEKKVTVQHLDYGTIETISTSDVRELPSEFSISSYKPQAHIGQLSLVNMPPIKQAEYFKEAIYYLEDTLLGMQVIACVTYTNPVAGIEFDVELYDPKVISQDPTKSINKDMVSQGWGLVKKKNLKPFEKLLNKEHAELLELENEAKSLHIGCWEFGDLEGDDDF